MIRRFINFFKSSRAPDEDFWIFLCDIPIGSVLTLITETQRYDFKVLSGHDGRVEVLSNHDLFPGERHVFIQWSWLSDNEVKIRSFAVGYKVQIITKDGLIWVTEPLTELYVNGRRDLPVTDTH